MKEREGRWRAYPSFYLAIPSIVIKVKIDHKIDIIIHMRVTLLFVRTRATPASIQDRIISSIINKAITLSPS